MPAGIFQSRIVRGLAQPLASAGTTAALVCAYEEALRQGVLPDFCPSLMLPPLPFDITSFALSLLLVFRTNTSCESTVIFAVGTAGLEGALGAAVRRWHHALSLPARHPLHVHASACG